MEFTLALGRPQVVGGARSYLPLLLVLLLLLAFISPFAMSNARSTPPGGKCHRPGNARMGSAALLQLLGKPGFQTIVLEATDGSMAIYRLVASTVSGSPDTVEVGYLMGGGSSLRTRTFTFSEDGPTSFLANYNQSEGQSALLRAQSMNRPTLGSTSYLRESTYIYSRSYDSLERLKPMSITEGRDAYIRWLRLC